MNGLTTALQLVLEGKRLQAVFEKHALTTKNGGEKVTGRRKVL